MNEERLRQRLLAEDSVYRRLHEEHRRFDKELQKLAKHRYLTDQDRLREVVLKKKKLLRKDEMAAILRSTIKSLRASGSVFEVL